MTFLSLIKYLRDFDKTSDIIKSELPGVELEQIDLYLKNRLALDSEVKFFDAEQIPNEMKIRIEGIEYVNLFPLSMLCEMVDAYINTGQTRLSDDEIAENVLKYRIKDA